MINYSDSIYTIEINEQKGYISSLMFGGREYVKRQIPLFVLGFRNKAGVLSEISTFDMSFTSKNNNIFCYECGECSAEAEFLFGDEIFVRVNVKNKGDQALEYIETGLCVPEQLAKDKYKILWGLNEGVEVDNFEMRTKGPGFLKPEYPGMGLMPMFPAMVSTQFMAYYDGTDGIYIASHDNNDNLKAIDFWPYEDGIKMFLRLYTGCEFGTDYNMDYFNVIKPYHGGWIEGAQIYRDWFEENKKSSFVKINENDKLPNWYKDSPIVVTYPVRGHHDMDKMDPNDMFPYINGLEKVEEIAKRTESKIMVLLMHWEGTAPWAPPYVWPPYGGEEELKKYIDALHKDGHLLGVYCSGLGYTSQSNLVDEYNKEEEFEAKHLERFMCASPEGKVEKSKICNDQRSGYDMCPTQSFTVETLKKEVEGMTKAGIDYIQLMDQNHGGTSYFCYSREHGHPPVPGKWQVDAVNELLNEVEGNSKVLFGCESAAAECYIPNLLFSDNRYNVNFWTGMPVPAYAYVYHEYLNNFMGNQVGAHFQFDYEKNPESMLMRMAYSFCAGDMLTFVLNDKGEITWNWGYREFDSTPDNEKLIDFARSANMFRRKAAKYLCTGKMIKPVDFGFGKNTIIQPRVNFEVTVDKVMTSKWQAEDGTTAQFLVNYNNYDIIKEISADDVKFIFGDKKSNINGNRLVLRSGSIVMLTNDKTFTL